MTADSTSLEATNDQLNDPVFKQEQEHLTQTYGKLREIAQGLEDRLKANIAEIEEFKGNADDELATNLDESDSSMETYAEYAVMNNVVDSFNLSIDADAESLRRVKMLIEKPYFAKVTLQFPGRPRPRDIYLGSTGVVDERRHPIVVDWRSPVAETYYNQQTGHMTYKANGRDISVDLKVRRQFDIEGEQLKSYFDTTVAISDPMLLASLSQRRTSQLKDITATIQREQNEIIRHEDVPALLVQGVAGSGKTSVMLQRIAYLLFQDREKLNADRVWLITPNKVFERYIWNVLPSLGERNPRTIMWSDLAKRLGAGNRGIGDNVTRETLASIDARVAARNFSLDLSDLYEIHAGDRSLISIEQIKKSINKFSDRAKGVHLMTLVQDDLLEKLRHRVGQLASSEEVHDEILALDADTQDRVFGMVIQPESDAEATKYARQYLEVVCEPAYEQIETFGWLRIDHIAMRLLGKSSISATEWLYLKMALTGAVDRDARFVMIDEVQDYSVAQLMVLERYFSKAHFLMLGDPNQAIRPGTASFDEIRDIFGARGRVDECRLMTSYRSSPEITDLFASLLPAEQRIEISSVQPAGKEPVIEVLPDGDGLVQRISALLDQVDTQDGLTAVIVGSPRRAAWLAKQLTTAMGEKAPVYIEKSHALPDNGTVLLDLTLAKGLEFDRVIIADAQANEYGNDDLSRRRLYTAISRATKEVAILAQGELTPLLTH